MIKSNQIVLKLDEAIAAGKDKDGHVIQIPVFDSITVIDGELYGVIKGYANPPETILDGPTIIH